ncbi:MAG: hypothetical protein A2Z20_01615 [Bdellovibrionales bacterium RBG_16_40_8]|nr:MAG: hypothetical protein A2Z20_01615 [Bdellovibrionales bacterium RBG_16_40_8]
MASDKPQPLVPIDPIIFFGQLKKHLLVQISTILLSLVLFGIGWQKNCLEIQAFALVFLILSQIYISRWPVKVGYAERLVDIYPSLQPSKFLIQIYLMLPLTWAAFVIFLSLKERGVVQKKPPLIFRMRGFSILCVALTIPALPILLSFISFLLPRQIPLIKPTSYWLTTPSTYYITATANEIEEGVRTKRTPHTNPNQEIGSSAKMPSERKDLSAIGLIVAMVMVTNDKREDEKSLVAADRRFTKTIDVLESLITLLEQHDRSWPQIFQFNPLMFLTATGAVEAGLISTISLFTEIKFRKTISEKIETVINEASVEIQKDSPSSASVLKERLLAVRNRLEATRSCMACAHWPPLL